MSAIKVANFPIDVKVSLVGLADSGKTSLVKFLKGCNFEPDLSKTD
jgi:GTPase SAR1 family protein